MTTRIVELRRGILKKNDELAAGLRDRYAAAGVLVLNLVSSPGTGKTAFLEITLRELRALGARVAALVGDLETDNDARRLAASGAPVRQINTHGICHLDAEMIGKHLEGWGAEGVELGGLDILFIENVGNLVCPSSYDLGERVRVALLSVTEGEDKPLKYPTLFNSADAAVITKMDLAEPCGFDRELALRNIREIRPGIRIFETSAKTGAGMKEWIEYLAVESGKHTATVKAEAPQAREVSEIPTIERVVRPKPANGDGRRFETVREAKEFLIAWIDAEARRMSVPLSEVERKMLYASATGWTLPDMEVVQDAFERYHHVDEYQARIKKLIRSIRANTRAGNKADFAAWTEAVEVLSQEDHYLLDLIAASGETLRRRRGKMGLWAAVLVGCGLLAAIALWMSR